MRKFFIALAVSLVATVINSCREEEPESYITILFTGDVLLDRGLRPIVNRQGIPYIFQHVQPIFRQADAVVINLECPITNRHTPVNKQFIFRADTTCALQLSRVGVTHAAMANNHTNDQGRQGLIDTYSHLIQANIQPLGYGITQEEQNSPTIIRKGATCVAIFNAAMFALENWHMLPDRPGICQPTAAKLVEAVETYRHTHPSHYIVCVLHWGNEFQTQPSRYQRTLAHKLASVGTDVIIGHHPHVIQPVDTITTNLMDSHLKASTNSTIVYYSLGNFVFDQHPPLTRKSIIARINFGANHVIRHDAIPIDIVGNRPIPGLGIEN